MGRYYNGDIEGKFWLGVQSSDDAEQFGAEPSEPSYINYYTDDLDACLEGLAQLFADLGMDFDLSLDEENIWDLADAGRVFKHGSPEEERQGLFASLELGLKMARCLVDNGSCTFEAEC